MISGSACGAGFPRIKKLAEFTGSETKFPELSFSVEICIYCMTGIGFKRISDPLLERRSKVA